MMGDNNGICEIGDSKVRNNTWLRLSPIVVVVIPIIFSTWLIVFNVIERVETGGTRMVALVKE